jgi:hypothetical protein
MSRSWTQCVARISTSPSLTARASSNSVERLIADRTHQPTPILRRPAIDHRVDHAVAGLDARRLDHRPRPPGAGHDGGRIVFTGTPADLVAAGSTLTGEHLVAYVTSGQDPVESGLSTPLGG